MDSCPGISSCSWEYSDNYHGGVLNKEGPHHATQAGEWRTGHGRNTVLSVLVESSGLGSVEAALSQLPCTLLTALFSYDLSIMVALALDQFPGALNLVVCGLCILCAGQGSIRLRHNACRLGMVPAVPVKAALDVLVGYCVGLAELGRLLFVALNVPMATAAYIKNS